MFLKMKPPVPTFWDNPEQTCKPQKITPEKGAIGHFSSGNLDLFCSLAMQKDGHFFAFDFF